MDIKLFLKKILGKSEKKDQFSSVEKSRETKSFFHWKVVVIVFALAVIVMFVNSYLIYEDISKGEFFSIDKKPKNGPSQSVMEVFEKTVGIYDDKEKLLEKATAGALDLPDPSL
jgi:hypothetical protein